MADYPYHEETVRAIIARLETSKYRVHKGAANIIADEFLPDGRVHRARIIAQNNGWPVDAVLAGLRLGTSEAKSPSEADNG